MRGLTKRLATDAKTAFATAVIALVAPQPLLAQGLPGLPPQGRAPSQLDAPPQPVDLSQMVADIVSGGQPTAKDYRNLAEATLQTGAAFKAAGQQLADSVIKDAIRATEEGRELAPGEYPWEELSERLKELLQEPPPQEQPQQNGQQGQDQQNPQDQQSDQDQQSSEGNSGQESQPSEQGERPQDPEGGQDQSGESQSGEEEQQGEGQERQPQQQAQGDRLGDMDTEGQEDIRLDQDQRQQPTQMVGGRQQPDQPLTADQALRLQQLEKVKQQDDPGKFFQILQQAEQGEEQKQADGRAPAGKDW